MDFRRVHRSLRVPGGVQGAGRKSNRRCGGMNSETVFGKLADVPLRSAWSHEAHRFTPWLAENLSRLAGAMGIPLELTGSEIRCGSFSADILARTPGDDSVVLIENQLEGSDHTHLGQIMTYLAGLETHTMVWVAPVFRDEHL